GITPIKGELDKIAAVNNKKQLAALFASNSRHMLASPFRSSVAQDDKDPEHYIANVRQSGLGLPDRDMYDTSKPQFEKVREGYKKYLVTMLGMAGVKDADKRAAAVYALEEKLAAVHWTRIQNRDPVKTYNKLTIA